MQVSPAVDVAWRIAAGEAAEAHHESLTSAHLVLGLFSLAKVVQHSAADLGMEEGAWRTLCADQRELDALLERHGLKATSLRRGLRETLGQGAHSGGEVRLPGRLPPGLQPQDLRAMGDRAVIQILHLGRRP